jgi:hypothetical protein
VILQMEKQALLEVRDEKQTRIGALTGNSA